jgi:CRISPR/Cas system-associated exonuclease Cas4 (RecB family)
MKIHRLSKSRFISGLQCERRLWMLVNRPQDKREPTLAEARRMKFGTEFGRLVTRLFPGGVEISADYRHPQEALDETAELLDGDAPALFEAAFLHHEVLIRADILKRSETEARAWQLIEVKSASNSAGSESSRKSKLKKHISDMAIQLYVLEGAGIAVESISLAWVNSGYRRRGELDWNQLVAIEDHSDAVRAYTANIGQKVDDYLALIDEPEMPEAAFGKTKCDGCEFNLICWGDEPEDSIIYLPRISAKKLADLRAMGVKRVPEIPRDFKLAKTQAPMLEAYRFPEGRLVEREKLEAWIGRLEYPLHFFDFETWNPGIPPFDQTWPYMQIPFQYSLHIQHEPGAEPSHREFLAEANGDPRPSLVAQLVGDFEAAGSIVAHHASFEEARIRELAAFSPTHAEALLALLDRMVDTEIPFKQHWYLHPGLKARSSIKVVLPTLVPELSYDGMEISEGMTAAIRFEEMFEGSVSDQVRQNLIDYCRLDTLAMLKIVEKLRELAQ